MVLFPPAKINLGLHVLGKRPDGYHALESIFLPLSWTDVLEVVVDPNVAAGDMKATFTGLPIPGALDDNLVVKAHRLLADQHDLPGLHLHLRKNLPMGGGMGGGSSDGTFALLAIDEVCELGLSKETLLAHSAKLGSDCPFFVDSAPAMVAGRGEHVTPLGFELPLDGIWIVVANPGIHISTAEAFGGLTPMDRTTPWEHLSTTPLAQWHNLVRNDFECGAVEHHPPIGDLLQKLREAGASYVQMTGSGSTVFGLFHDETMAQAAGAACGAQFVGLLSAG